MSGADRFMGWPIRQILLPDGERVVCLYCKSGAEPDLLLHDANHNIFRLDTVGNVVWQVKRDEQGKLNWEAMHRHARAKGEDGCREPFGDFVLIYPDGRTNIDPGTGCPPSSAIWEPGCVVQVRSFSSQIYELAIRTGVATNVTPRRQRPW